MDAIARKVHFHPLLCLAETSRLAYLFSNEPPIGDEVHESGNKSLHLQAKELWDIVREEPLSSTDDPSSHYSFFAYRIGGGYLFVW